MLDAGSLPEWHLDAACAEHTTHADDWFPEQGESTKAAKEVCQRCLVQGECLAWALEQPMGLPGIWGGTSRRERKSLIAAGVTGDLVREYGVHAIAGQRAEHEREIDAAVERLRLAV